MSKNVLAIVKDKSKFSIIDYTIDFRLPENKARATLVINQLKDTLRANDNLIALAAPQIGIRERVFCLRFSNGDIRAFVNPLIIKSSKESHLSRERCASGSGLEYIVPRKNSVMIAYQTPLGVSEANEFKDAAAEVVQQMMNLLDGVLIDDWGLEVIPEFDKATKKDQTEVIKMYLEYLQSMDEHLKEEIQNNPSLRQIDGVIRLGRELSLGNVQLVPATEEDNLKVAPPDKE